MLKDQHDVFCVKKTEEMLERYSVDGNEHVRKLVLPTNANLFEHKSMYKI